MPSRWNTAGKRAIRSITSIRENKGEISTEKRNELSTHAAEAAKLGGLVRRHWGIENRCHWVFDMTFDGRPLPRPQRSRCENSP
jgi:predicted transposase YbfD/YdcC